MKSGAATKKADIPPPTINVIRIAKKPKTDVMRFLTYQHNPEDIGQDQPPAGIQIR